MFRPRMGTVVMAGAESTKVNYDTSEETCQVFFKLKVRKTLHIRANRLEDQEEEHLVILLEPLEQLLEQFLVVVGPSTNPHEQ